MSKISSESSNAERTQTELSVAISVGLELATELRESAESRFNAMSLLAPILTVSALHALIQEQRSNVERFKAMLAINQAGNPLAEVSSLDPKIREEFAYYIQDALSDLVNGIHSGKHYRDALDESDVHTLDEITPETVCLTAVFRMAVNPNFSQLVTVYFKDKYPSLMPYLHEVFPQHSDVLTDHPGHVKLARVLRKAIGEMYIKSGAESDDGCALQNTIDELVAKLHEIEERLAKDAACYEV